MSKVYLLTVSAGTTLWQRMVSVQDTTEFLGIMRVAVLKEMKDNAIQLDADQQADFLRSLRLRLTDTGLAEMPETEEEQVALWNRMTNVDNDQNRS